MKYWMSISNKTNKKYTNILSREKHNFSISKYKLFNYNAFGIRTSESGLLWTAYHLDNHQSDNCKIP